MINQVDAFDVFRAQAGKITEERVADLLEYFRNRPYRYITQKQISQQTGVGPPATRAIINILRRRGTNSNFEIVSNGSGYCYTDDAEAIRSTIGHLKSRARSLNEIGGAMVRRLCRESQE